MLRNVCIDTDVVGNVYFRITLYNCGGAVSPRKFQFGAVGIAGGIGISDDRKSVGEAGNVFVCNLARPLMCSKRYQRHKKRYEEKYFFTHLTLFKTV